MPARQANNQIILEHPSGSSATVELYGATVVSWVAHEKERLFVSQRAVRDGSKAIRGGIPLVFPVFGTNQRVPLPQHGFARISRWKYAGVTADTKEHVAVNFDLSASDLDTTWRDKWPHKFRLRYTVTLGANTLRTDFSVKNEGTESFDFNVLLHTYLSVSDIAAVSVKGLHDCEYADKVAVSESVETRSEITVASEVDRVYRNASSDITLNTGESTLHVTKHGMRDVVVWNPWIDKAAAMADFGDDEYRHMICIEVGTVADWVTLESQTAWSGGQVLSV